MTGKLSIEVLGLAEFVRAIEYRILGPVRVELPGAIYREGERMMTLSKLQVPVDTGTLRSTGSVSEPSMLSQHPEVSLGYGGPAAPYALIVHEDLNAHHTVGKAKYLEDPVRQRVASGESLNAVLSDLKQSIG